MWRWTWMGMLAAGCGTSPDIPEETSGFQLPPRPVAVAEAVVRTESGVRYVLPGDADYQSQLYVPLALIDDAVKAKNGITTYADEIRYWTAISLQQDRVPGVTDLTVTQNTDGTYTVSFSASDGEQAELFAKQHQTFLDAQHAGLALYGSELCQVWGGCWNPMSGYPVNTNPSDGDSKWHTYLPLGMGMLNQKSALLMHYPPWVALQNIDYLDNMTLKRWQRLLHAVGLTGSDAYAYQTIVDVNPIAAPGSGESEYNNDYFPILLSTSYFDNALLNATYIRSMVDFLVTPPTATGTTQTLPLLVGGSPLYDPQAPAWFRVSFKDQLPKKDGIPQMEVLQTGRVTLEQGAKPTPYMGTNHMIAAGVTGTCTNEPSKIPDMRRYEAEDLVAACWVTTFSTEPDADPAQVLSQCCTTWFGNAECAGAPAPGPDQLREICVLAEIDLFFDTVKIAPKCSMAQAQTWCESQKLNNYDPCPVDWETNNCTTVSP